MASQSEKVSESVLTTLTKDLKPDTPVFNQLKRSWEELERHKFSQIMRLQHRKKEIEQRLHKDLESLRTTTSEEALHPQNVPLPDDFVRVRRVPGFHYRANGTNKQSLEDAHRDTVIRPCKGLSRHVIEKKCPLSGKLQTSSRQTPGDGVLTTDTAQGEEAEPCPRKHSRPAVFADEDSAMRVRKVQEQLGLNIPLYQGSLEGDRNTNVHSQIQPTFRAGNMLIRSSETEVEKDLSLNNKSCRKKTLKDTDSSLSQNNSDAANCLVSSVTSLRLRCEACRHVSRSEVSELVRCLNPVLYVKPRWRPAPIGRYVPPPASALRSTHPALFPHSRSVKKGGTKSLALASKASFDGQTMLNMQEMTPDSTMSPPIYRSTLHKQLLYDQARVWQEDKPELADLQQEENMSEDHSLASYQGGIQHRCDGPQARGERQAALTPSTLQALRKKNSEECEAVQQKMHKFLQSLGQPEERSC